MLDSRVKSGMTKLMKKYIFTIGIGLIFGIASIYFYMLLDLIQVQLLNWSWAGLLPIVLFFLFGIALAKVYKVLALRYQISVSKNLEILYLSAYFLPIATLLLYGFYAINKTINQIQS